MRLLQIVSSNSIEDQKKKIFTAIWYAMWPEYGIFSSRQPLFRMIIQTLTLNGESAEISLGGTLKSRWGDTKSQWERFTLDEGRVSPTI